MRKFNKANLSRAIGISLILFLLYFLILPDVTLSNHMPKEGDKDKIQNMRGPQKITDNPFSTLIDVNNITLYVQPTGFHFNFYGGSWSSAFPKGTAGGIYQEGIVWGGIVNDGGTNPLRVGGNTYFSGTQELDRIYRVRPDYQTADLTDDAANFYYYQNYPLDASAVNAGNIQELRDQYAKDWLEWPADKGAPYDDVDGDGIYNPTVDIPGIPGASQTIWIYYNDALAPQAYGSPPIGIEVQQTFWAYAVSNPLSNVIFKKVNVVYKGVDGVPGNSTINDMYLVQWADPDVGQYTDDFAGCDSLLNLGYAYSSASTDAVYLGLGMAPPALGYDFLQGVAEYTGNSNDSAIVNLKWRKGYQYVLPPEKPMTVFTYFAAGGAWQDPTGQDPEGTPQWYNLMRGFLPRPPYPESQPFPAEVGGTTTGFGTYLLSGDPVAGTGFVDGVAEGPGDRRIVCVHGPFNMALNDSVEIVVALLGGIGSTNLSSVSVLKYNDRFAQYAYDNLFDLPLFPSPTVNFSNLDQKVVLNWGENEEVYTALENASPKGYTFQGYNIYQFPNASFNPADAIRLATYDVVDEVTVILDNQFDEASGQILQLPVQFGGNSGIKRYIEISTDAVRNQPLRNGQEYYFGVSAYGFNPDTLGVLPFKALESSIVRITAVPQSTLPGVRYSSSAGDSLEFVHYTSAALSDGSIIPIVIDPSKVTGHRYLVKFDTTGGSITWSITDSTSGQTLIANQTNQSGDDTYAIKDGIMVKVLGPPPGMKDWEWIGARKWTWANGNWGAEGFNGAIGNGYDQWFSSSSVTYDKLKNVEIRFANTDADGNILDPNDLNASFAYRYLRNAQNPPAQPEFAPYIINTTATYDYQDYNKSMPIAAYDMESDPPRRLMVGYLENNAEFGLVNGSYWPPYNADEMHGDNIGASGPREWFYIFDVDYSETPDPNLQINILNNTLPIMWFGTITRRNLDPWSSDDTFIIYSNHINTLADVFSFTSPTASSSSSLAKTDVEKINVFPNPYYGFQYRETTREGKYVTFSHLPTRATIRIFDLAGTLVRTIDKNDESQFTRWNLQNNNNYPVASGIYIVYIDMPGLGTTKILKLALIQEEQILRVY